MPKEKTTDEKTGDVEVKAEETTTDEAAVTAETTDDIAGVIGSELGEEVSEVAEEKAEGKAEEKVEEKPEGKPEEKVEVKEAEAEVKKAEEAEAKPAEEKEEKEEGEPAKEEPAGEELKAPAEEKAEGEMIPKSQYDALMKQLLDVSNTAIGRTPLTKEIVSGVKEEGAKPAEVAEETAEQVKAVAKEVGISDEEYDNAMNSPEGFRKVIGRVLGILSQRQEDFETKVQDGVAERIAARELEGEFYKLNPDLEGYKSFVDFVTLEIKGEKQYGSYAEMFEDVGKEVRTRLGLGSVVKIETKVDDAKEVTVAEQKPAFAKAKLGSRQEKATPSELEDDIKGVLNV